MKRPLIIQIVKMDPWHLIGEVWRNLLSAHRLQRVDSAILVSADSVQSDMISSIG